MTEKRNKVLIITYSFPPIPRVSAQRMQGLAKYLPHFGWDPTFLTVNLPGEPEEGFRVIQTYQPYDVMEKLKRRLGLNPKTGLQKQLGIGDLDSSSKKLTIGKFTKRIEGWISFPDKYKTWRPIALKALGELLSQESFDALISTSPPVTINLIASQIQEEFNLPWIADFRDLWSEHQNYSYGLIRKFFDKRLEKKTLKQASALVTVSMPLSESLQALHKGKAVSVIPNGFDPDTCLVSDTSKKFTIIYTGQIYRGKQQPEILFEAISDLLKIGQISKDLVEIHFYGPNYSFVEQDVSRLMLDSVVKQMGVIPREEVLSKQRQSQVLLLLNWTDAKQKGIFTGKIFEYLAARRPILALGGPKGVVSDLLEETGAGIHPRTAAELRSAILSWYEEFQNLGYVPYHGNEKIYDYSHEKMAQRFAEVLDQAS